jgi:beta-lactamase class A
MVTVRDLATLMIIVSDNTATDLLLDVVGKAAVNATLTQLGFERTRVDLTCREILYHLTDPQSALAAESDISAWRRWRIDPKSKSLTDLKHNNVSTPREMAKLLELVHDGHAASPTACASMMRILQSQQVNDRIPLLLPRSVEVAHKTGELPGIRNDAGIVYSPSGPYLFVCFTRQLPREGEGCWNIGQFSRAVFDYFGGQH